VSDEDDTEELNSKARPETGPMKFLGDWCGTFIRGDASFAYARSLEVLMDPKADEISLTIAKMVLANLLQSLNDSDESRFAPMQQMYEYHRCKRQKR